MPDSLLVEIAVTHLFQLCDRFPMGYVPKLVWKSYRVTAGMAYYRTGTIGLSCTVLKTEEAVRETVGHEYAHLLAIARHGERERGHGNGWKRAMFDLGLEPKVRHNYEVDRNVRRQQVDYRCLRCGATIVRSRRLPRRRRYVHANCGGDLRLLQVSRVTPGSKQA
ncbi:MAG TPA: SprT-like domain-containing protein [Fimbriimonas sp.]|nr:SprT-like domain-containing protein [Fimbriimonas sp.]